MFKKAASPRARSRLILRERFGTPDAFIKELVYERNTPPGFRGNQFSPRSGSCCTSPAIGAGGYLLTHIY